jgi:hypothetical protein
MLSAKDDEVEAASPAKTSARDAMRIVMVAPQAEIVCLNLLTSLTRLEYPIWMSKV